VYGVCLGAGGDVREGWDCVANAGIVVGRVYVLRRRRARYEWMSRARCMRRDIVCAVPNDGLVCCPSWQTDVAGSLDVDERVSVDAGEGLGRAIASGSRSFCLREPSPSLAQSGGGEVSGLHRSRYRCTAECGAEVTGLDSDRAVARARRRRRDGS
jgi:hypothetical protein